MNEMADQALGGYVLEEEIGRGSMGIVYRGKQIALERDVAIKVLPRSLAKDASYVARFIREAQIVAGLNHPNIVQIYDAGQQDGLLYFVMEYIQGPTLSSLLHSDGTIPQHLAAEYAAQIADALDAAYQERHIIHRDIKPENLMLDRRGKIKVMDFGLARATGQQKITIAKKLVGSIYYASPEQIWGQELDNRSDIYALGVVLYEMVSGRRPFTGRSLPELSQAITGEKLKPPMAFNMDLSPALERVILKAMARDRNERYMHAASITSLPEHQHEAVVVHTPAPDVSSRGHAVHPPKRPQVRRPVHLEVDLAKSLADQPTAHSSAFPVRAASELSLTRIKTVRLPAGSQELSGSNKRRTLWRRLRRILSNNQRV